MSLKSQHPVRKAGSSYNETFQPFVESAKDTPKPLTGHEDSWARVGANHVLFCGAVHAHAYGRPLEAGYLGTAWPSLHCLPTGLQPLFSGFLTQVTKSN